MIWFFIMVLMVGFTAGFVCCSLMVMVGQNVEEQPDLPSRACRCAP